MDRETLAYHLNVVLYNLKCLTHANQYVHWNTVSSDFWELHKMTEQFYERTFEFEDLVAEEVRKLGYLVSPVIESDHVFIDETRYGTWDEKELIPALLEDHEMMKDYITDLIKDVNSPEFEGTKNLLADIQSNLYKHIWFLQSCIKR